MKHNVKILVVDDESMMRTLLEKILSRDGYSVTTANTGREALTLLTQSTVNLVICDVKMPDMNGFEVLKAIKQEFPAVGVIMMTAYGDTFTVKDALLLGADEYVTKPFKSHEISMIVERAYWRLYSANRDKELNPSR